MAAWSAIRGSTSSSTAAGEPSSRDYDFSDISISYIQEQGYALVKDKLARQSSPGDDLSAASRSALPRGSLPSVGESERLVGASSP